MSCQTSAFLTIRKSKFHDWNSFLRVAKDFFLNLLPPTKKQTFKRLLHSRKTHQHNKISMISGYHIRNASAIPWE